MVYAVYHDPNIVQLIGVAPRGDIYKRLGYTPEEPNFEDFANALELALDPNQETPTYWSKFISKMSPSRNQTRSLPYQLNTNQLQSWNVPRQYQQVFQKCKTEDDLLSLDIPQEILLHVINCIWPPDIIGITQAPNLLINKSSDIIRYYEGDLLNFLLALDDEQQKLVDFSLSGPTLVKGGPGSGKSTVALYRVGAIIRKYIAERKPVRILFTTYTNALISASNQLLQRILEMEKVDPNSEMVKLDVQTLDSVAMQILKSDPNHLMMSTGSDMKYSIASARSSFLPEGNNHSENININKSLAALRDEYLLEEFDWVIEGRGLSTLHEYLTTDRVGRGYSFDARIRRAVWQLYQRSRDFLHQLRQTTWGELRLKAIEKLLNGEWTDKWDYVFVDEAQDLTPVA